MYNVSFAVVLAAAFLVSSALSKPQEKRANQLQSRSISTDHIFEQKSRGILEFGLMIICGTGKNPLSYNGYGCYCGIGGKGTPVDDTDRCCKAHDECYTTVANSGLCPASWTIYVAPYSRNGCTGCKPASYYWFYGKCRSALCQCDSVAVECFKRSHFNAKYKDYPQSKC